MLSINICDFGAKGDGICDDSVAIQAAIDKVSIEGGTVVIPSGLFRMKKGVKVPLGVNIEGQTNATTGPWQNYLDSQDKGTSLKNNILLDQFGNQWIDKSMYLGSWILVDHGANDVNSDPTFRLEGNTSIKKIGFVHVGLPPITNSITEYPPAIAAYSSNELNLTRDGITVEDISLANCYIGIAFVIGNDINCNYLNQAESEVSVSFGRHRIHNIMGGPLYKGILIKGVLDTIDINNVQFNYSCYELNYTKFRTQHCIDFHFVRVDGLNISNILSFGSYKGIYTESGFLSKNVSLRAVNLNIEAVMPLCFHSNGMYEISNSYFLMVNFSGYNNSKYSRAVQIISDPSCRHQSIYLFNNCVFQNSMPISIRENAGSCDDIDDTVIEIELNESHNASFENCMFWGWGAYKEKTPVITYKHTHAGIASCSFNGCNFTSNCFEGKLIRADGQMYKNGEILFSNCRIPNSLEVDINSNVWYSNCIVADKNGNNKILKNI